MVRLVGLAAAVAFVAVLVGQALGTAPLEPAGKRETKAVTRSAGGDVVLRRGRNGHFFAEVDVNGTSIGMLADTGASVVALSVEDAESAGIAVDSLNFNRTVSTANGEAEAAYITLDEVSVGSITRRDVKALVARGLSGSLLGMSFFNSLSRVAIESDEMVLED